MEGQRKNGSLLAALAKSSESLSATYQMLKEPATIVSERVPWCDVKKAAEQVSREATTSGMLWSGTPNTQEAKEKLKSYVNQLQGFLLLCHGTTVGAGPTLLSVIQNISKQVLESSLALLQNALSIETQAARQEALPPLTGCVWETCESLQKAPSENRTAIGRAIVQIGTSMKDVLREMNEVKLDEQVNEVDLVNDDDFDFNFDPKLTSAEMEVAEKVKAVIEAVIVVARQVIHVVSKANDGNIQNMETILQLVKSIGAEIDELGASVYPPQELECLKDSSKSIDKNIRLIWSEVMSLNGSVPELLDCACEKAHESHVALLNKLSVVNLTENIQDLNV